jgi:GR25 family glycosyltransferase involved in LPS biosynthesis
MRRYSFILIFPIITVIVNVFYLNNSRSNPLSRQHNKLTVNLTQPSELNLLPGIRHCLFINLDHRLDRLNQFLLQINASGISCERVEGVDPREKGAAFTDLLKSCFDDRACPGQLGCQLSHLKAVDLAIKRNWSHVAIFEDDFMFQPFFPASHLQPLVESVIQNTTEWSVIGLSLNIYSQTVLVYKPVFTTPDSDKQVKMTLIHDAQTTGGLIFRDTSTLRRYRDLISLENCDVRKDYHTAIDQCMKPMQRESTWIGFQPQIGTQRGSFSDIERVDVQYGLAR